MQDLNNSNINYTFFDNRYTFIQQDYPSHIKSLTCNNVKLFLRTIANIKICEKREKLTSKTSKLVAEIWNHSEMLKSVTICEVSLTWDDNFNMISHYNPEDNIADFDCVISKIINGSRIIHIVWRCADIDGAVNLCLTQHDQLFEKYQKTTIIPDTQNASFPSIKLGNNNELIIAYQKDIQTIAIRICIDGCIAEGLFTKPFNIKNYANVYNFFPKVMVDALNYKDDSGKFLVIWESIIYNRNDLIREIRADLFYQDTTTQYGVVSLSRHPIFHNLYNASIAYTPDGRWGIISGIYQYKALKQVFVCSYIMTRPHDIQISILSNYRLILDEDSYETYPSHTIHTVCSTNYNCSLIVQSIRDDYVIPIIHHEFTPRNNDHAPLLSRDFISTIIFITPHYVKPICKNDVFFYITGNDTELQKIDFRPYILSDAELPMQIMKLPEEQFGIFLHKNTLQTAKVGTCYSPRMLFKKTSFLINKVDFEYIVVNAMNARSTICNASIISSSYNSINNHDIRHSFIQTPPCYPIVFYAMVSDTKVKKVKLDFTQYIAAKNYIKIKTLPQELTQHFILCNPLNTNNTMNTTKFSKITLNIEYHPNDICLLYLGQNITQSFTYYVTSTKKKNDSVLLPTCTAFVDIRSGSPTIKNIQSINTQCDNANRCNYDFFYTQHKHVSIVMSAIVNSVVTLDLDNYSGFLHTTYALQIDKLPEDNYGSLVIHNTEQPITLGIPYNTREEHIIDFSVGKKCGTTSFQFSFFTAPAITIGASTTTDTAVKTNYVVTICVIAPSSECIDTTLSTDIAEVYHDTL